MNKRIAKKTIQNAYYRNKRYLCNYNIIMKSLVYVSNEYLDYLAFHTTKIKIWKCLNMEDL